jgi:excisionase family DNA binding protein
MTEHSERQTISSRMSIPEIARRLSIGRQAVYAMLEQGILPGIRIGRRWLVTRYAFESWERTCGMRGETKATDQSKMGADLVKPG